MINFTHGDCGEKWTNTSGITWSSLFQRSVNVSSEILILVSLRNTTGGRPFVVSGTSGHAFWKIASENDRFPYFLAYFWSPLIIKEALTFLGKITLFLQTLQICKLIIPAAISICLYGPRMYNAAVLGTSGGEVNSHPKKNNVFFPLLAHTLQPRWYTADLAHFLNTNLWPHFLPFLWKSETKACDDGVKKQTCVCVCFFWFFYIIPSNNWLTEFTLDFLMVHRACTQSTKLCTLWKRRIIAGWQRQTLTVDRISDVDTG